MRSGSSALVHRMSSTMSTWLVVPDKATNTYPINTQLSLFLIFMPLSSSSLGHGMSSMIVPTWRWRAALTRPRPSGNLSDRSPRRCSSPGTSTTCAPNATANQQPPSPSTARPTRKRLTRSRYEDTPIICRAPPTFCFYFPLCYSCCLRYSCHDDTRLV